MQQDANRTPLIRTLMPLMIVVAWILILVVSGIIRDGDESKPLVTIKTGESIAALDWSPDGGKLVSGGRVWDATNGKQVQLLQDCPPDAHSVDWSPDGTRIAGTGQGGTSFMVWDAHTGEQIYRHESDPVLNAIAWSPDSEKLATSGESSAITIWDASTGEQAVEIPYGRHSVAWSPDGRAITATPGTGSRPAIFDANTAAEILVFQNDTYLRSAAWSPDGSKIAYGGNDTTIYLIDTQTGEAIRTYTQHTSTVVSIAWRPNGAQIASAGSSGDNRVRIWDPVTGETLKEITASDGFTAVAWSPDGSRLAVSRRDGTIQIWDTVEVR